MRFAETQLMHHSLFRSAAGSSGTGGISGAMDSPPAMGQGPSSYNDSSSGTNVFAVAGTVKRAVILACCSLLALFLSV